jgi:hypothetical protein
MVFSFSNRGKSPLLLIFGILAIIIMALFTVVGLVIKFFPFFLLLGILSYFRNKSKPKKTYKNTYYYNTQDFEEFFRQAQGQYQNSYQQGGYYNGGASANPFQFENKDKYYKILGIEPGASPEEIKKAYRKAAIKYHPDKYSNASEAERKAAEEKFKEINEAYNKLQN